MELEEKVSTLEKKLEEVRATRKEANKAFVKAKKEIDKEREAHGREQDAFTSCSQEVMEHYRKCLHGADADIEFLGECTMEEFMICL